MATTYVYHAYLGLKWESGFDYGLFHNKADAKKACQDEQTEDPIDWTNGRNVSSAPSALFSDGEWTVTRRPIR